MSAQLRALAEPIELLEHRTMHGKTFLLPDGRIKALSCVRPYHWNDNGTWVEVDETPRSKDGEIWTTHSTPYEMMWDSERLELNFRNKRGGEVTIRLVALDDVPIYRAISGAKVSGNSVRVFAAPELEIELRCRTHNVEIFKILHGPNAPRRLTWEVIGDSGNGVKAKLMETTGRDNLSNSQSRKQQHPLNRRRLVELLHTRTEVAANTYRVTEEFTGRTRFINPVSHARSWIEEVEWPIEIDVTVTTAVTADQDDGRGQGTISYWRSNYIATRNDGSAAYGGFRFLTVNVPQGQVLDSATLTINVTARSGSQNAVIAGENVDSAATWADTSSFSPHTMSATTANTTYATPAATGIKTIDVKTSCQEVINRAGWAANNNLRLGFTDATAMTTSYFKIEDLNAAGGNPASLAIIYTPAVAGSSLLLLMPDLVGGMDAWRGFQTG